MRGPEGKLKDQFNKELKKLGCIPIPYVQSMGTRKGFPDELVLLPEGLTVYIEFKASKSSRYQPLQKEWLDRLQKMGYFAWAVCPANAKQVLEEIKALV